MSAVVSGAVPATELCRVTGASYRQVDYWRRIGLLIPVRAVRGSGDVAAYELAAIPRAKALLAISQLWKSIPKDSGGLPWQFRIGDILITVEEAGAESPDNDNKEGAA